MYQFYIVYNIQKYYQEKFNYCTTKRNVIRADKINVNPENSRLTRRQTRNPGIEKTFGEKNC